MRRWLLISLGLGVGITVGLVGVGVYQLRQFSLTLEKTL